MSTIISVIIPAFNSEKTIQETVNSVLRQTFRQFELVIINPDSTDATLEIISQIADPRIKIFSYPQANASVNRNRGFKHSVGELVAFLDADDLWTPNKLESQYKALRENPAVAIAYSWTNCIDETGKFLRHCSYVNWTGDVYDKFLLDDFIGTASNPMIRREAFISVNGFDESLVNGQDTDLWFRLAEDYHFTVVTEPQILYRISRVSLSSNILSVEASNLRIINRAFSHPKAANFQYLRRYSIANLYKNLSYKALDVAPGQQKTLQIIRVLIRAITSDPSLIFKHIIYKAFLKLLIMTLIHPKWANSLFTKFPKLSNTSTFLGYEKTTIDN